MLRRVRSRRQTTPRYRPWSARRTRPRGSRRPARGSSAPARRSASDSPPRASPSPLHPTCRASSTSALSAPRCRSRGGRRSARRTSNRGAAAQPLEQGRVVELVVLLRELTARDECAEAHAVARLEQRKADELGGRRHREQLPVAVEADLRRTEAEAVAEPELLGEAANAVVGRQNDVVEAVGGVAVEVERADET